MIVGEDLLIVGEDLLNMALDYGSFPFLVKVDHYAVEFQVIAHRLIHNDPDLDDLSRYLCFFKL